MSLSAPTQVVFLISVIVAIVGLVVYFGVFSFGIPSFWIMTIAYIILLLGNVLKGM